MTPGDAHIAAPLAELRDITRSFVQAGRETRVLRGISLTLHRGDFLALVGSSGSGKSTLLHILGLLDQPDSGTYALNGRDVAGLDDEAASLVRSRFIGFVFQSFYLMPRASALENVMLPGMYTGERLSSMRERAMALLDQVGLADRVGHIPAQLSGGQQQRVSLARALFNEPDLLLADEPTGQLDAATSEDILALFQEINASGTSIVVVTHDPQTAQAARRSVRVHDGLVVADGGPAPAPACGDGDAPSATASAGLP
jgi:putative ABC transport system ATP-binding protein